MDILVFREPTLYRAKFVLPIESPLIQDGAVITTKGRITAVGPYRELKKTFSGRLHDLGEMVLMPALVNAHTHLELSALKWRLTPSGSFITWVKNLIRKRTEISAEEVQQAAQQALDELWKEGIGLVGDVGNTGLTINLLREGPLRAVFFREVIDFKGRSSLKDFIKDQVRDKKILFSLSPHAPYTVSPVLLQAIKSWTRRFGLPFSLHVAESPEEVLFLKEGRGPIRLLLEEREQWNASFEAPKLGPVAYLERLGVLDADTICVHTVQVSEKDLEILAKRKARPCLCPRSNTFLGVGLPPVDKMLAAGLEPCLGTDSLASNDRLSIFAELETLARFFPTLPPEVFLKMATLWGAEALKNPSLGRLAPGARAEMIAFPADKINRDTVYEYVVSSEKRLTRVYG